MFDYTCIYQQIDIVSLNLCKSRSWLFLYKISFLSCSLEKSWRDNWIFNRSGLSFNSSLGGGGLAGRTLDEVYVTVPQPDDDITARVGNR